jgi:hypothetical protein
MNDHDWEEQWRRREVRDMFGLNNSYYNQYWLWRTNRALVLKVWGGLPMQLVNALSKAGYSNPYQTMRRTDDELLAVRNVGVGSVRLLRRLFPVDYFEPDDTRVVALRASDV